MRKKDSELNSEHVGLDVPEGQPRGNFWEVTVS